MFLILHISLVSPVNRIPLHACIDSKAFLNEDCFCHFGWGEDCFLDSKLANNPNPYGWLIIPAHFIDSVVL